MNTKIQPHESYERIEEARMPSERSFGLVMAAFFVVVALFPLLHGSGHDLHWWAFGVAAAFAAAGFFWTSALRPLNWLWLRLGRFLHSVISPIVIGLVFFAVVWPIGLILRALGRDHLRLRRNPSSPSYWVPRGAIEAPPDAMKNQF
jgi:hypothetical protein